MEKKEGKFKGDKEVLITDLPGIYSLSPYTLEEVVARDYLVNEKPQAIMPHQIRLERMSPKAQ